MGLLEGSIHQAVLIHLTGCFCELRNNLVSPLSALRTLKSRGQGDLFQVLAVSAGCHSPAQKVLKYSQQQLQSDVRLGLWGL